MKFNQKEFTLKDGRLCTLRHADPQDAPDLIHYLKTIASETRYLTREPEEIKLTQEQEEALLKRLEASEKDLMLIAVIDGKHIGNCSMSAIGSQLRYSHRCGVAIAIYQEYCGLGLGKAMLQTVLEVAAAYGYEQAELEVVTTNQPALRLYQTLGFQIHGMLPDSMKYIDGTYADVYWMMKKL